MKRLVLILTVLISINGMNSFAQNDFPEPMQPPRMVNDFVGFLNANEIRNLEQKLRAFDTQTSNQISIVIVKSLNGYEPNDYATRLATKWGIGSKGKDNGVLILVKPKTASSKGEVYITPGYGLEGAVTDVASRRIVANEILPYFQRSQFYNGLNQATNTLIAITRGEYTSDQYVKSSPARKSKKGTGFYGIIPLLILITFIGRSRGSKHSSVGRSLPFWLLLGMMGSGHSRGSGFSDFSSGSGGFGGGGFGGFGGGGFGGGGAGGSW
ncbi:TPM domain-containing protein [Bacteroidota bacterium]